MKEIKYKKEVELGIYKFNLAINRAIFININQKFSKLFKKLISGEYSQENLEEKVREGEISIYMQIIEDFKELIGYSLPLMLKEAGEENISDKLIEYAFDNDVFTEFSVGIIEFIMSVFQKGETSGQKIHFKMV